MGHVKPRSRKSLLSKAGLCQSRQYGSARMSVDAPDSAVCGRSASGRSRDVELAVSYRAKRPLPGPVAIADMLFDIIRRISAASAASPGRHSRFHSPKIQHLLASGVDR